MQPHAFTPRGRKEMQATFPDVYDALIDAGHGTSTCDRSSAAEHRARTTPSWPSSPSGAR
jgi:hypothetical protein